MSFIMRALVTLLRDILFVKGVGLAEDVEIDEGGLVHFKPDRNVSSKQRYSSNAVTGHCFDQQVPNTICNGRMQF
jgi:hypothetical protein